MKLLEALGPAAETASPQDLSNELRLLAPMLETVGVFVIHGQRTAHERPLTIERRE